LGRHTDPETLAFIRKLKEKGESLGYRTEEEYPMLGGLYFADLIWQLAKDQAPLVTFEVETSESLRVFKNTSKYFDNYSKNVPKPFRHFMILMKGKLPEGVRLPMQRYLDYYNVSLFEDVANDQEAARILFEELDRLKVRLRELVARYLSSGKIDETIQQLILGIKEGMPKFIAEPKDVTITFGSENRLDPLRPFKFKLTAKTPPGSPTLMQRLTDALKTGEPVRLTKADQVKVQIPGVHEGEVEAMEIRPEAVIGTPVRLETPNYTDCIELVLIEERDDDQFRVVSNAKQDAPWRVSLIGDKTTGQVEVKLSFDSDRGDPYQFIYFVDFIKHAIGENRLTVREVAGGKVLLDGPFSAKFEAPSEDWMQILRALAEIQRRTNTRFPIPKEMSGGDLKEINRLHYITSKGEVEVQASSLTVNFTRQEAEHRLDLAKNPDIIENFQATMNETPKLFGKKVPIGEAQIIIPKAKIDLSRLSRELEKGTDPIQLEIQVLPDKPAKIVYRNWMSNRP
jgi:hypothetical protein